jgi:hypothetical protein
VIRALSNRVDLVSGGDALVEVDTADPSAARIDVDGRDVTSSFALRHNGRFQAVLSGLAVGANTVTASMRDGSAGPITIDNHPIGGPVISGSQTQPWLCTTEQNGLGPALDAQCDAATKLEYLYKSTDPTKSGLRPYDPANPPSDVATTTTDDGRTEPFIVRVERGVINRGIYTIAVPGDPHRPWEPWGAPGRVEPQAVLVLRRRVPAQPRAARPDGGRRPGPRRRRAQRRGARQALRDGGRPG